VGPGVASNGIDSKTWTDHVDIRPTLMSLVGLKDDYLTDGRVVTEILGKTHDHDDLHRVSNDKGKGHNEADDDNNRVDTLGAAYKQVNAPFGQFALDTLVASTSALKQPDTQEGNLRYEAIETQIANLTVERDALAGAIRAALNSGAKIDEDQARDWIKQAQSLLDRAHALAAANPA
jgi:hypothetical protein